MTDTPDTPIPSPEDAARLQQTEDSSVATSAPDPTGATDEQLAAKQGANALGDQDATNLAGVSYPAGAEIPTPQNVRRYPELFSAEVIDSFNNTPDPDQYKDENGNVIPEDQRVVEGSSVSEPVGESDTGGRVTF